MASRKSGARRTAHLRARAPRRKLAIFANGLQEVVASGAGAVVGVRRRSDAGDAAVVGLAGLLGLVVGVVAEVVVVVPRFCVPRGVSTPPLVTSTSCISMWWHGQRMRKHA